MQSAALRYFLEVARTGSVSAAAQRLRVAASAVSRQIANLEKELDASLFERRTRGMILTQAGQTLAVYAQRLALENEQLVNEIRELSSPGRGLIKLGVTEGLAVSFVPEVIHAFRQDNPEVAFDLRVLRPPTVTEQVRTGGIDIGVTFSLQSERAVTIHWQRAVQTYAFVAPDHPLLAKKPVRIADIFAYPIATLDGEATVSKIVNIYCSVRGLTLDPVLTSTNLTSLLHFCQIGGAVIFASTISFSAAVRAGAIVPLAIEDEAMPTRSLQVQTMSGRALPRVAMRFLERLTRDIETLAPPSAAAIRV